MANQPTHRFRIYFTFINKIKKMLNAQTYSMIHQAQILLKIDGAVRISIAETVIIHPAFSCRTVGIFIHSRVHAGFKLMSK